MLLKILRSLILKYYVKLLNYSKSKAYDKAALLIAYDGEDKTRILKDSFNPV